MSSWNEYLQAHREYRAAEEAYVDKMKSMIKGEFVPSNERHELLEKMEAARARWLRTLKALVSEEDDG